MNKEKSFTLIEILVVIVVIGILSAFILVGIGSISENANIAKSKTFVNSLDNSLLLGRVGEWKMDEGSGTNLNNSWNTHVGTLTNFNFDTTDGWRTSNQCVSNSCLEFDGTNDYINLGTAFGNLGLNDFTVSLWFKIPKDASYRALLSKGIYNASDFLLYKINTNDVRIYCDAGTILIIDNSWSENKWNNVVITREGAIAKMYMNGKYVNQDTTSAVDLTNSHNWNIGASEDGTQRFIDGFIDEVRVYNQAMPSSKIKENYFIGLNNLLFSRGIDSGEYSARIKYNLTEQ